MSAAKLWEGRGAMVMGLGGRAGAAAVIAGVAGLLASPAAAQEDRYRGEGWLERYGDRNDERVIVEDEQWYDPRDWFDGDQYDYEYEGDEGWGWGYEDDRSDYGYDNGASGFSYYGDERESWGEYEYDDDYGYDYDYYNYYDSFDSDRDLDGSGYGDDYDAGYGYDYEYGYEYRDSPRRDYYNYNPYGGERDYREGDDWGDRADRDRMNRDRMNRDRMNRERMNRDRMNRDRMNRDRMDRDRMDRGSWSQGQRSDRRSDQDWNGNSGQRSDRASVSSSQRDAGMRAGWNSWPSGRRTGQGDDRARTDLADRSGNQAGNRSGNRAGDRERSWSEAADEMVQMDGFVRDVWQVRRAGDFMLFRMELFDGSTRTVAVRPGLAKRLREMESNSLQVLGDWERIDGREVFRVKRLRVLL